MRLAKIEPFIVHVPLTEGIADSTNAIDCWGFAGVIIHADNGLKGYGFTGTHAFLPGDRLIASYISSIYGPLIQGEVLEGRSCIARIWTRLHGTPSLRWIGRAGASHLALAAVDVALWDLLAKSQGVPLWKMLHDRTEPGRLEAYNTNAGWLNNPIDKVVAGCLRSLDEGFKGVKIKVGSDNPEDDLGRVEAVRKAIGPHCRLMIDANGKWNLEIAEKFAPKLDAYDLFWFEEPLYFDDLNSHIDLAKFMKTPIALGEQLYSKHHFDAFMRADAVKYVQPDALRVAGISEWLAVADEAYQAGLPVVPHVGDMMQVHRHLSFAHPSSALLEYIPWTQHCFEEPAIVRDGEFLLPEAPGAGTTLKAGALADFGKALT